LKLSEVNRKITTSSYGIRSHLFSSISTQSGPDRAMGTFLGLPGYVRFKIVTFDPSKIDEIKESNERRDDSKKGSFEAG
jgi:hypothetical protein